MADYKCPKCGGSDYFMSQRNVVKGMGWAQRGSIKSIPVCRVCDEIMEGAQVGLKNWEDYGTGRASKKISKISRIIFWSSLSSLFIFVGYVLGDGRIVKSAILFTVIMIISVVSGRVKNKSIIAKMFYSLFIIGSFFLLIEFMSVIGGIFGIIAYSTFFIGLTGFSWNSKMGSK